MWLNLRYIEWLLDNPHMAVGDLPPGAVVRTMSSRTTRSRQSQHLRSRASSRQSQPPRHLRSRASRQCLPPCRPRRLRRPHPAALPRHRPCRPSCRVTLGPPTDQTLLPEQPAGHLHDDDPADRAAACHHDPADRADQTQQVQEPVIQQTDPLTDPLTPTSLLNLKLTDPLTDPTQLESAGPPTLLTEQTDQTLPQLD